MTEKITLTDEMKGAFERRFAVDHRDPMVASDLVRYAQGWIDARAPLATGAGDIAQRLRENAAIDEAEHCNPDVVALEREAADEIERLRGELSNLRAPVADERAAFETAMQNRGQNVDRWPNPHGGYRRLSTEIAWYAWNDRTALGSATVAGEPFMYGIMGPDGKAHFEEFCVSGDRTELQTEVVDHLNRDNPEDGTYSVVALFRDAAPQASAEAFDFAGHLARQAEFSALTFGPGARVAGVCDHIRKELIEVETSGGDLKEWVDVIILGLDGAWRSGATPQEIIAAIIAKQAKNEARTWPDWRTMDPNKAIEHQRTAAPCSCPSGDGSLRHPCAEHPADRQQRAGDDLISALGECRDAFPIPDIVGSRLDLLWQEAMSDPTAVPAYVKACAVRAALSATQPEQGERDAGERNGALEQAARLCESLAGGDRDHGEDDSMALRVAAEEIRSLKGRGGQ